MVVLYYVGMAPKQNGHQYERNMAGLITGELTVAPTNPD